MRKAALLVAVLVLLVSSLSARVISYAPVTDRFAIPAVQNRMMRHFLLMESDTPAPLNFGGGGCPILCPTPPTPAFRRGSFVLYDAWGERQPRDLFPGQDPEPSQRMAAMWEAERETPRILLLTDARVNGDNAERAERLLYSADAGRTWKIITLAPGSYIPPSTAYEDVGGPFVRGRGAPVRLGNSRVPFVFLVYNDQAKTSRVYRMLADGTPEIVADMLGLGSDPCCGPTRLIGSDREGRQFLITGAPRSVSSPESLIWILDVETGSLRAAGAVARERAPWLDGWITPEGSVYVEDRGIYGRKSLKVARDGVMTEIAQGPQASQDAMTRLFAIPTHDFRGAWVIQREPGQPTVLSRHSPGGGLLEQWRDISAPQVEALHAGSSGERLLIQVHRPRPMIDQRMFIDPALALWEVGQPAPREYDELYLIEGPGKAFVHLDVEWVTLGEPFIFDGASITEPPPPPPQISPAPGGTEVVQEWGVVRSSLRQKLVLPGVARLPGLRGSFWRTDIVLRNPSEEDLTIGLQYVPIEAGQRIREVVVDIAAGETRLVRDALQSLFGVDSGGGAVFITPELGGALHVTSRSYTESPRGSYGTAIWAFDVFAAASPRFPVTFAAAFPGPEFRTNVLVTDTSASGTRVQMEFVSPVATPEQRFRGRDISRGSHNQFNSTQMLMNIPAAATGALEFRPESGQAIASVVVIDNRSNDPTWFAPDLPAPYVRVIPMIAHVDEPNGNKVRSDLYLYNASDSPKTVFLNAKGWNENGQETRVTMTLQPRESRVVPDALSTLFSRTGLARLRYQSGTQGDPEGVRVTSRMYTVEPSGIVYGMAVPPLNAFQAAAPGDALEILSFGGETFRTDLSLVELTAFPSGPPVRVRIEVIDARGRAIDQFDTEVPVAGGVQLRDVLRARGLGHGPGAFVIRVSPFGGMVGAFASAVDVGTNDPMYLAAALAAR